MNFPVVRSYAYPEDSPLSVEMSQWKISKMENRDKNTNLVELYFSALELF